MTFSQKHLKFLIQVHTCTRAHTHIQMYLKDIGYDVDWIELAKGSIQWWAFIVEATNFRI